MHYALLNRRQLCLGTASLAASAMISGWTRSSIFAGEPAGLAESTLAFIRRCSQDNGGYSPSPDPTSKGIGDTEYSDLAAVMYAAALAKTMGWELPHPERSIDFIQRHQQPDGSFVNHKGKRDAKSDLSVLWNTVSGLMALRALGARPKFDPLPIMGRFFVSDAFKKLPLYSTSFFPIFYAIIEKPFPEEYDRALRDYQIGLQTDDGYLEDHVPAAFHMAHYFRLVGAPTPKAEQMVARVLRDQRPDGSWNLKHPGCDVHACFDAVFILRQLGGDSEPVRAAINKAADWALSCRNSDGGFGSFRKWRSDMDAVYFQFGTLIQAERLPTAKRDLPDGHTVAWGHAMQPGKIYGKDAPQPAR